MGVFCFAAMVQRQITHRVTQGQMVIKKTAQRRLSFTFSATHKNSLHLIQKTAIQTDAERNSVLRTFEI